MNFPGLMELGKSEMEYRKPEVGTISANRKNDSKDLLQIRDIHFLLDAFSNALVFYFRKIHKSPNYKGRFQVLCVGVLKKRVLTIFFKFDV